MDHKPISNVAIYSADGQALVNLLAGEIDPVTEAVQKMGDVRAYILPDMGDPWPVWAVPKTVEALRAEFPDVQMLE